ncbi:MAG: hypothetical protein R3F34_15830 [Planctomycetota bacterium]
MTTLDVERLFHRARGLAPRERTAFLDDACGGDASVRSRVEALLTADAGSSGFLADGEGPASPATPASPSAPAT